MSYFFCPSMSSMGFINPNQFAYPTADSVDGAWSPSTGVDLYATVDETPVSDADYMFSNAGAPLDAATLTLNPALSTPQAGAVSVVVRHRIGA